MSPINRSPARNARWFRPSLEWLEHRLPPGDTILGLLVANGLLAIPLSDSSLDSASSFDSDSSFILHSSSLDSDLATWPIRETSWPGDPLTTIILPSITFSESEGHLANSQHTALVWPPALRIAPHRATTESSAVTAAPPSFPGPQAPLGNPMPRGSASQNVTPTKPSALPVRAQAELGHEVAASDAEATYGALPFYFEQNLGQADESFDFMARGQGYALGLSATEAIFSIQNSELRIQNPESMSGLASVDASARRDRPTRPSNVAHVGLTPRRSPDSLVRMQLVGANPTAQPSGADQLITKINYFLGNDPNQWHTNVPAFAKVQYDEVYPGIDLVYYATPPSPVAGRRDGTPPSPAAGRGDGGEGANLEYDFIVSPGSDPNQIQLSFTGADSVELDPAGNLILQTGDTELRQQKPYLYQEENGQRQQVAGEFKIANSESRIQNSELETQNSKLKTQNSTNLTFAVGDYDLSRPLVIDPVVLSYSTHLGGAGTDIANAVAVDDAGNAYVAGHTYSLNFPVVNPVHSYDGGGDVFIAKFNSSGSSLIYATYLGGEYLDEGLGIAVQPKGAAFVTGFTESDDFPTTAGAFQQGNGSGSCKGSFGCADAFVAKLSPDGSSLMYSTLLGGNTTESGHGIALDAVGSAYITGMTSSPNFPTKNAVQAKYGGGLCTNGSGSYPCYDSFITKLNVTGSGLVYSTFLGGDCDEGSSAQRGGIAVDPAGHAIVTGETWAWNNSFPTHNAIQRHFGGGFLDAFVTKLTPDGKSFIYSTYLGGSYGETGYGVATDADGNAYVGGTTASRNFPTTPNSFQPREIGEIGDSLRNLKSDLQ